MKPTKEIIGLRIISIVDGTLVSSVRDIVLNPQTKSLDFIVTEQPIDVFGAKVIPFSEVSGVGEFAVMIPGPNVLQDVGLNDDAKNLLRQGIKVIGTKVLTKKGQMIGTVTELLIDENTGKVSSCIFESNGQVCQVGADQVVTFGKELLIIESVPENLDLQAKAQINETPGNEAQAPAAPAPAAAANPVAEPAPAAQAAQPAEPVAEASPEPAAEKKEEGTQTAQPAANFNLFEQRQLQYFIGKKTEIDIALDNGETLRAGEVITPETITRILTKNTLMEISSHLQKN